MSWSAMRTKRRRGQVVSTTSPAFQAAGDRVGLLHDEPSATGSVPGVIPGADDPMKAKGAGSWCKVADGALLPTRRERV